MKQIIITLLIMAIGMLASAFTEIWYAFVFPYIVAGYWLGATKWKSFVLGFLSIFIAYMLIALQIDMRNDAMLSRKIAELLKIPAYYLLPVISGLIAAIPGGIATALGASIRNTLTK